jgi:hypothetical protein
MKQAHTRTNDDGSVEATATTKDGSTDSDNRDNGLLSSANPEEAVKEAVKDAMS